MVMAGDLGSLLIMRLRWSLLESNLTSIQDRWMKSDEIKGQEWLGGFN